MPSFNPPSTPVLFSFPRHISALFLALLFLTTATARISAAQESVATKPLAVLPAGLQATEWAKIQAQINPSNFYPKRAIYAAPLAVNPYTQQTFLKASNAEASDGFGIDIAIDGDTLVVGAPFEDSSSSVNPNDNSTSASGAVYVFIRDANGWMQQAYLKANNAGAYDHFGTTVAISGDTLVVGAPFEDSNSSTNPSDNGASNSGAAYVFTRIGNTWSQQAYLKSTNTEAQDLFGVTVAIDAETIIVGAPNEDSANSDPANNSASSSGAAYIFTRNNTSWSQQAYLKAAHPRDGDNFASDVAIDGDTVVIGAYGDDGEGTNPVSYSATRSGAVYVFVGNGTSWSQQAYLKASNIVSMNEFGSTVALSRDTLVVGSPWEEGSIIPDSKDGLASNSGRAYVFIRTGNSWSRQGYLYASNAGIDDHFGTAVAISGDTLIVGASGEASANGDPANDSAPMAGAAYVFSRSTTLWSQQDYLKASNAQANDLFGVSVAISSNSIVVGAPFEDSAASGSLMDNSALDAGAAYLFTKLIDVTINQASSQPDPTSSSPIMFEVVFSEPVTGFTDADVTLSGTAGATTATISGSGSSYTIQVSGMTQPGTVMASIAAGVAQNGAGQLTAASTSTDNSVSYTLNPPTVPTVTINQASSQPDPTSSSPIMFEVFFSEPVTGFTDADVTLGGTAGATTATISGSGSSYTIQVSGMTQPGTVMASIAAGVAQNGAGQLTAASTSTDNSVSYRHLLHLFVPLIRR